MKNIFSVNISPLFSLKSQNANIYTHTYASIHMYIHLDIVDFQQ